MKEAYDESVPRGSSGGTLTLPRPPRTINPATRGPPSSPTPDSPHEPIAHRDDPHARPGRRGLGRDLATVAGAAEQRHLRGAEPPGRMDRLEEHAVEAPLAGDGQLDPVCLG